MNINNLQQALGQSETHLTPFQDGERVVLVHASIVEPLLKLKSALAIRGFDLGIVSGFRSFERQLAIFSAKAEGKRILLDDEGKPLDFEALSLDQRLWAILRWSALPGASRHHWGTDIDVYDKSAQSLSDVQLVPSEVNGNGPSAAMHDAIDDILQNSPEIGFYRPYQHDVGGVAPERWHLSFAPIAAQFESLVTETKLLESLKSHETPLLAQIVANLPEIFTRFIRVHPINQV